MNEYQLLVEAFNRTSYPLSGHGKRNIQVLMEAFKDLDENLDSDIYGSGPLIENFQKEMAEYLGKESAVFFPSGTMAQQIALRIGCDLKGRNKVAYHPLCHLEIHEQDGLKKLHHIEPVLLADKNSLISLEDVQRMDKDVACLLLELPQREIGGQLPVYSELEAISAYCREQGILLHLDGARLFEVLPFYGKTAAEICRLFDSVYVSFYKGIGGIAGAILAGSEEFTKESKVWKRRHGGDLISLYPYITAAEYYFKQRIHKMGQYYEEAKELAGFFNQCQGVSTLPLVPVSNMFHVHFEWPREKLIPVLIDIYETTGIGFTAVLREVEGTPTCYYEVSIGDRYVEVPKEKIREAFQKLDEKMQEAR